MIRDANGKVSQWIDKTAPDYSSSNTNNHMVQATAANQPTWGTRTYNGLPVMDFDGNDWLETLNNLNKDNGPSVSHSNFFIVAYVDSVDSAFDSIFALRSTNNDFQFDAAHASNFYAQMRCDAAFGTSTTFSNGTDLKDSPWSLCFMVGKSMCDQWSKQGNLSNPGSAAANKLIVGTNRNADSGIDGWIGEILTVFTRPTENTPTKWSVI